MDWESPQLKKIIDYWIEEDIGRGDLTKKAVTREIVKAYWIAKEEGIFCGGEILNKIFSRIDNRIKCNLLISDGDKFAENQSILNLEGPATSLLASERISLNIAMHLSGISTYTYNLNKKLESTNIKLADTRKTTPGLRNLEKYAFHCGGGTNHRMGLYDAAMLKENHIAWSSDLDSSIKLIRSNSPFTTHIIVEAENIDQAKNAIIAGADSILLDEIDPKILKKNIDLLREISMKYETANKCKRLIIEVSGIKPEEIEKYLIEGIDLISTSSATTKSKWIDFSMRYID